MSHYIDVYISSYPFSCGNDILYARRKEIDSCKHPRVKQEKFYVWKLLELGLKESLGLDIKDVKFEKLECGKWICDKCHFSLSHTDDFVAVAISNVNVGIDIELLDKKRDYSALKDKVLFGEEKFDDKKQFLTIWTIKEAYFKTLNQRHFMPNQIDLKLINNIKNDMININDKDIMLSLVSDKPTEVRLKKALQ